MTPTSLRLIQSFLLARQVNHFYWLHTDGDDPDGKISLENLQRVIERMTRLPIHKKRVFVDDAPSVRGSFERYSDRIEIYIRDAQGELWERYTCVKELCHSVMDKSEEYSVDVIKTIKELRKYDGITVALDNLSPATRSEKFAELMALELIYPIEFRQSDRQKLTDGETIGSIASRRGVPAVWVEHALGEYLEACADVWRLLPTDPMVHKLDPL